MRKKNKRETELTKGRENIITTRIRRKPIREAEEQEGKG